MTIDAQNSLQLILSSLILGTFPTLRCGCIRLAASITMSLPAGLIPTGPTRRWKKEFAGYTNQKRAYGQHEAIRSIYKCVGLALLRVIP